MSWRGTQTFMAVYSLCRSQPGGALMISSGHAHLVVRAGVVIAACTSREAAEASQRLLGGDVIREKEARFRDQEPLRGETREAVLIDVLGEWR